MIIKPGFVAVLGLLAASISHAAPPVQSWQLVAVNGGERLEVDKSRISRLKNGQSAAWSRLTLGFDLPDATTGVSYTAIEALNTYDCGKGEYTTVKRVYMNGSKPLRDERVKTPQTISINRGSFEDKLLAEVCKPRSVAEMKPIAELAALLMNPEPAAANKAMPADMRTEEGKKTAEAVNVVGEATDASKPRMIELPKIDKSQVEDPYAKPPEAKPAEPAKKPEPAKKAAPPVTDHRNMGPSLSAYERSLIERQLATSGLGKANKARAAAVDTLNVLRHWDYDGAHGPDNWGKLQAEYSLCSNGKRQSPIDIRDGIRVDLEPIAFNYRASSFSVIDNGHTVQVNVPEGFSSIRIMERNYHLLQFHFHRPAEERVNGRSYEMVAHLVHKSESGQLAVVAVLIEVGTEHPIIQTVWNNLPLEQNLVVSPAAYIDVSRLLPEKRDYWTYMGSLTTPPCSEGVLWMVLKQPIQVSPEQINIFTRFYRNNARPVQPTNGRLIKETR